MKPPKIILGLSLAVLTAASVANAQVAAPSVPVPLPAPPVSEPFAPEIARFAELDAASPPPACAYLFVGSSSIRFWKSLNEDMAPYPTINRGFGGAHVSDVDLYFDRVVAPYKARAIFFYAGDNDLWTGKSPETVLSDFRKFMDLKTRKFGDALPVYFIAIKPSKQRFSQLALQGQVNSAIRTLGASRKDLRFVDVVPVMLEAGSPKDIFIGDGLHMTPAGYALWTSVVRPVVEADAKTDNACNAAVQKKKGPLDWLWGKKS